jgi:hypothetical protein
MAVTILAAGCTAVFEIRYFMAIQESRLSDWHSNSLDTDAERVALMVESSEASTVRC